MEKVIGYYEGYDEGTRLGRDRVRQLEFATTTHVLEPYLPLSGTLLDIGAGTGAYAFYYAARGVQVTAADVTPGHVKTMRDRMEKEHLVGVTAELANAMDLSRYASESFDTVLCLGPLYHLRTAEHRNRCLEECMRVLKPGGVLAAAYINRFFIAEYLIASGVKKSESPWLSQVAEQGTFGTDEPDPFLSAAYFHTPSEAETELRFAGFEVREHVAVEGNGFLVSEAIGKMSEDQYRIWMEHHFHICREPSRLGSSNHGLIVAQKKRD